MVQLVLGVEREILDVCVGSVATLKRVHPKSVFDRYKRREAEINEALQEEARREAAVKNMQRLRALRLARDGKIE
jgi:hypothetical protein